MASLSIPELKKRNNMQLFLSRIRSGGEFLLENANGNKIKLDKSIAKSVNKADDLNKFVENRSIVLPTVTGTVVRLSAIYKDSVFSGRTQATTAAEDAEVASLNKQLTKIRDELGTDRVPLKVGTNVYNVSECLSTPGTPKCDFHFLDVDTNTFGGHVSHKDGVGPRAFQQWAGTSARREPRIAGHPETQSFIEALKEKFPNGMPSGTTVGRKIIDNNLKMMAVYGGAYGGPMGENNVDVALQGTLRIQKRGQIYRLTATSHTNNNGSAVTGQYEPIFLAVYKGDRSDHGIKNARITINPLGGRTVKEYI